MIIRTARGLKPPVKPPKPTSADVEANIDVVGKELKQVLYHGAASSSFSSIHQKVTRVVYAKRAKDLFDIISNLLRGSLDEWFQALCANTPPIVDSDRDCAEKLLAEVQDFWTEFSKRLSWVSDCSNYMERAYCIPKRLPRVFGVGRRLFCDLFQQNLRIEGSQPITIQQVVTKYMTEQFNMDRDFEVVNHTFLSTYLQLLTDISEHAEGKYSPLAAMELDLLEECSNYYGDEAVALLSQRRPDAYCRQATRRLKEEAERCAHLLSASAAEKMVAAASEKLVHGQLEALNDLNVDPHALKWLQNAEEQAVGSILKPPIAELEVMKI